jgi:hypothetical protein
MSEHNQLVIEINFNELKEAYDANSQIESPFNLNNTFSEQINPNDHNIEPSRHKEPLDFGSNYKIAIELLQNRGFATKADFIRAGIKLAHPMEWNRFMRKLGDLPGHTCEKTNPALRTSPLRVIFKGAFL